MKLTIFILIISFIQVSGATFGQSITLRGKNVSIEKIFREIRKQTGYDVLIEDTGMKLNQQIAVEFLGTPLEKVLDRIVEGRNLTFTIEEKVIVIKSTESSLINLLTERVKSVLSFNQNLSGIITDSVGSPLIGASVSLKGTKSYHAITDGYGQFVFNEIPEGRYGISITYIGYNKLERSVEVKQGITPWRFILRQASSELDQVQVIGYGTTTKRFNVGSVNTIDAKTISNQPVTNVLLALQGQVPGLAVDATSGVPGSRVLIQIRGQNTLLNRPGGIKPYDQPLFIIDGVPFAPQNNNLNQLGSLASTGIISGGLSQAGGFSPLNAINPADIESISILKDADATSIYGSQGSNGVVLITTKRGKAGKTQLGLTVNTGFNTATNQTQLMNTQQYLQLRRDAFAADGITPTLVNGGLLSPGFAPDLLIYDQNKYTDWQQIITGKTSQNTDVHASLSGGVRNTTFLVSGGFTHSEYNFPGDYANQRLTLHTNLHHGSTDNRFELDFGADVGYGYNNSPGSGGAGRTLLPPNLPDLIDPSGNLVWNFKGINLAPYQFYGYLKTFVELENYNFNNNLRIAYKILPGLKIGAGMGYNRNTSKEHSQNPGAAQDPTNVSPSANFANSTYQSLNIEPQIDYTASIGKGRFSALLGGTYRRNVSNSVSMQGTGYANDNFLGSISGAATKTISDNSDIYKYAALFARLNYVYDQKYIINLTGRRDGSSNFGPGNQFGNFGSAGLGWIVSEEKWFKNNIPFISYGKLSSNYGTSGSDGIQSFQYQAFWRPVGNVPSIQGIQPSIPVNLFNPDYSWALKKTLNTSMDLGFFNDRILINATYYKGRTGNQLGTYTLPSQVGLLSVIENLPAVIENSGWEFSLNSTNIRNKSFNWSTNFNIAFNDNKLIDFPELATSAYRTRYVIGQPTSVVFGYALKGLNTTTGLFEYFTKDGTTTNSPRGALPAEGGDYTVINDGQVKFSGGMGNNLSYKNISFSFFIQFSSRIAPNYLQTLYSQNTYLPGFGMSNLPIEALDYWKAPGDATALQKLSGSLLSSNFASAIAFASSSGAYSDATYARLKTVSLSYSLPERMIKSLQIRSLRVYANAQNLLTFTNFKVYDPEQLGGFTSLPLQRTIVFGLNLNL